MATGRDALCIYFTRNDCVIYDGELVLVDVAGSLSGYFSDVSPAWPVSGIFS